MDSCLLYTAGDNAALKLAIRQLKRFGCNFTQSLEDPVTHLLLPVPSLDADGNIRGGGDLQALLEKLPRNTTVIGGNLPAMEWPVYDLLQDPVYVAENAYITAHCAVRLIMDRLPTALRRCPVLVIGWGRIGKCLAALLKGLEANVTVAARKETDRAMLTALGYPAIPIDGLQSDGYRVILNTVPVMVLPNCHERCLKIDLASMPGIGGEDVLWARGLPGKDAPEASGELIARTVLKYLNQEVTV